MFGVNQWVTKQGIFGVLFYPQLLLLAFNSYTRLWIGELCGSNKTFTNERAFRINECTFITAWRCQNRIKIKHFSSCSCIANELVKMILHFSYLKTTRNRIFQCFSKEAIKNSMNTKKNIILLVKFTLHSFIICLPIISIIPFTILCLFVHQTITFLFAPSIYCNHKF